MLVSPVTFRQPGNLAKVVATVAEMSGGRVELGVGAGWNELEHLQHGLPFPPIGERFDMLEEELAILHGLWTEPDGWCFGGTALAGIRRAVRAAAARATRPAASEPDRWWRGRAAHGGACGALRRRDQYQLGDAGGTSGRRMSGYAMRAVRSAATRPT